MRRFVFSLWIGLVSIAGAGLANAQESGLSGFLHRAGAAVKTGASHVLGQPAQTVSSTGEAPTTTGAYYRPGRTNELEGLFDHWRQGDAWPRTAIMFTQFGSQLPCWTAVATVWRSPSSRHEETFQVCNAPIVVKDDMGNTSQVGGPALDAPMGDQLFLARNVPGISHAETSASRNTGPNPPAAPFGVNITGLEGTRIRPMYDAMIIRLAWVTGYINHDAASVNNLSGKSLWIAGFDPAGNHDH